MNELSFHIFLLSLDPPERVSIMFPPFIKENDTVSILLSSLIFFLFTFFITLY
jgi:hypothetical protein